MFQGVDKGNLRPQLVETDRGAYVFAVLVNANHQAAPGQRVGVASDAEERGCPLHKSLVVDIHRGAAEYLGGVYELTLQDLVDFAEFIWLSCELHRLDGLRGWVDEVSRDGHPARRVLLVRCRVVNDLTNFNQFTT